MCLTILRDWRLKGWEPLIHFKLISLSVSLMKTSENEGGFSRFERLQKWNIQSLFQLLLTPSIREQLFLRNSLPYSFLKTSKTTCRLGERSFQVPKLWVKIYNFAYLLEFVVHFCLTARMPLHSTRSTEIYKLERIKSKHFPSKKNINIKVLKLWRSMKLEVGSN